MNSPEYFIKELDATREIVEHCFDVMPPERITMSPPHLEHPAVNDRSQLVNFIGEWSPIHVLIHMLIYEEMAVVPEMERFVLNKDVKIDWDYVEKTEQQELESQPNISELLKRFKKIRDKQIDLLKITDDKILNKTQKETLWGMTYLNFVVNKTIQHTISHGSKLYQKTMYWDAIWNSLEERIKSKS